MLWPEKSEETFRSLSQAATSPPVYHTWWRLHTVPLIAERQAGKLWIPIFIIWFNAFGNRTQVYRFSSRRFTHTTTLGVSNVCLKYTKIRAYAHDFTAIVDRLKKNSWKVYRICFLFDVHIWCSSVLFRRNGQFCVVRQLAKCWPPTSLNFFFSGGSW